MLNQHALPENLTATCFLVSAIDIEGWDSADNFFKNDIELYKHSGEIVKVDEVRAHIIKELQIFCHTNIPTATPTNIDNMYGNLCLFLDEKVAAMHSTPQKNRMYRIPLQAFEDIIRQTQTSIQDEFQFRLKENVYNYITRTLVDSVRDCCKDFCENQPCSDTCVLHRLLDEFCAMKSTMDYIKIINPSVLSWESEFEYAAHATKESIQSHIVQAFYYSRNPEMVTRQTNSVTFKSNLSHSRTNQVLPTLLDLTSDQRTGHHSLQKTLQNIRKNIPIQDAIAGNTILARETSPLSASILTEEEIENAWNNIPSDSINNPYEKTEIVSEDRFLEELKTL